MTTTLTATLERTVATSDAALVALFRVELGLQEAHGTLVDLLHETDDDAGTAHGFELAA